MLYTLFWSSKVMQNITFLFICISMIGHNGAQQSHDFLKLKSL